MLDSSVFMDSVLLKVRDGLFNVPLMNDKNADDELHFCICVVCSVKLANYFLKKIFSYKFFNVKVVQHCQLFQNDHLRWNS